MGGGLWDYIVSFLGQVIVIVISRPRSLTIFLDELDVMLSFNKEKMAKYLKFDEVTHTVQIIGDAPTEILKYSDCNNKLDVKKLYENFLKCVYQVVKEMSKKSSEDIFESLSVDWKPCTFGGKDTYVIFSDKMITF